MKMFDRLCFYTEYEKNLFQQKYHLDAMTQVGPVPGEQCKVWYKDATFGEDDYIVYNDYWNEGRNLEVVMKPNVARENRYLIITRELDDEEIKLFTDYAESNKDVDIYIFDFTEAYKDFFESRLGVWNNLKYYEKSLTFCLMKQYMKPIELNS